MNTPKFKGTLLILIAIIDSTIKFYLVIPTESQTVKVQAT